MHDLYMNRTQWIPTFDPLKAYNIKVNYYYKQVTQINLKDEIKK